MIEDLCHVASGYANPFERYSRFISGTQIGCVNVAAESRTYERKL